MSDLLKQANDFCSEFLKVFEAEQDPVERVILLRVLQERVDSWTIQQRLNLIQKTSKEAT